MQEKVFGLRLKVMLGLSVFLLLVLLATLFQVHLYTVGQSNHRLLGELTQLEYSVTEMQRVGQNYLDNPARDYESYDRDVQVFLREVLDQVNRFEALFDDLKMGVADDVAEAVPAWLGAWLGASSRTELQASLDQTAEQWQQFRARFFERLGEDEDEPRLEWGAEHLAERGPDFAKQVMALIDAYRQYLEGQNAAGQRVLWAQFAVLALLGGLGILWFYLRVTRRIGEVAQACRKISGGEFGHTVKVTGNDEITTLARALNTLSSRSQLAMTMISGLQRSRSAEQALTAIVQSAGNYLPIAWASLLVVEPRTRVARIASALPAATLSSWGARAVGMDEPFGKQLFDALIANQPVVVNELRKHALGSSEDAFLRELIRASQVESLVAIPLSQAGEWEGFLLFGSKRAQYRPDQLDLLKNLAPTTAFNMQRILTERAAA